MRRRCSNILPVITVLCASMGLQFASNDRVSRDKAHGAIVKKGKNVMISFA